MNAPAIFAFDSQAVRVQLDDAGQPWFNAADVCAALEYANPRDAIATHVDEDDVAQRDVIDSMGRNQSANHISESGLYALVFGSRKESARRFKRWVTSEVLPAIRRTGGYALPARAGQADVQPAIPAHAADRMVAASRTFGALLRSARAARVPLPAAIRRAAEVAQRETGIDLLAEMRIDPAAAALPPTPAPAPHGAGITAADLHWPSSAERFWQAWSTGQTPWPLQACSADQAWRAYRHWCKTEGERWPLSKNAFARAVIRAAGGALRVRQARLRDRGCTLRIWLPVAPPDGAAFGAWAAEAVRAFELSLKAAKEPPCT